MTDLPAVAVNRRSEIAETFGKGAAQLPLSVTQWLRWHLYNPEYAPKRWAVAVVKEMHWREIVHIPRQDLERALGIARDLLQPSKPSECLAATVRLQAVARRQPSIADDEKLALSIYAEKLAKYPASAVEMACEKWLETSPFWPSVSELLEACEWAMTPRRTLAFEIAKALRSREAADATETAALREPAEQ